MEYVGFITCFIYFALIFRNKIAVPLFAAALLSEFLHIIDSEYTYALSSSVLFGFASLYFINKNIKIALALFTIYLTFGYLAIDAYINPDIETTFYSLFSYIITTIDLYIIYILVEKDVIRIFDDLYNTYIYYSRRVWFRASRATGWNCQYL